MAWFVPLFGDMGGLSFSFGIGIGLGISGWSVLLLVVLIFGFGVFGTWFLTIMDVHGAISLD